MSKNQENNRKINLISFGFKHSAPPAADIIMDVRFLQNPHWIETMRDHTGLDADVGEYIEADPNFKNFISHFKTLIEPLIPLYFNEDRIELKIAIGCTGGHHRSVYVIEKLAKLLDTGSILINITHRDINH